MNIKFITAFVSLTLLSFQANVFADVVLCSGQSCTVIKASKNCINGDMTSVEYKQKRSQYVIDVLNRLSNIDLEYINNNQLIPKRNIQIARSCQQDIKFLHGLLKDIIEDEQKNDLSEHDALNAFITIVNGLYENTNDKRELRNLIHINLKNNPKLKNLLLERFQLI